MSTSWMCSSWENAQIHSLGSSRSFSNTTSRTSSSDSRHRTLMSSQSPARNRLFKAQANWLHFKLQACWAPDFLLSFTINSFVPARTTLCYRADVTTSWTQWSPVCVTQTFLSPPPFPHIWLLSKHSKLQGKLYIRCWQMTLLVTAGKVLISTIETRGENFLKIALVITSHHNEILYHPCCDFELIFCPFKSRDKGEFCCFSFFGLPSPVLCIRLHAQVDKLSKRVDSGRYIFKQIHTTNLIRTLPTFLSSKRISNFWVISSTTRQRGKNFNCYF